MIHTIEIKNFRRFRHFRLEGLTNLTILTGPNGCGKSTVLDALHIAASNQCAEAVGITVKRHPTAKDGARYLFGDPQEPIELRIGSEPPVPPRRLRYSEHVPLNDAMAKTLEERGSLRPFRLINAKSFGPYNDPVNPREVEHSLGLTVLDLQGNFESFTSDNRGLATKLVDPANPKELAEARSQLVAKHGLVGKKRLLDLLQLVVPEIGALDVLAGPDKEPYLASVRDHYALPLGFEGDGVGALLQIAIEAILVEPGGLVLIEEPEVFLHPKAISVVASLLLELMREGRQIVLTTHSLELIDALLAHREDEDLERMSLFNLRPAKDEPVVVGWRGDDLRFARGRVGEDLR